MKQLLFVMSFLLLSTQLFSQQNARNGYYYAPTGEIKMFVVFADVVNDTLATQFPTGSLDVFPNMRMR